MWRGAIRYIFALLGAMSVAVVLVLLLMLKARLQFLVAHPHFNYLAPTEMIVWVGGTLAILGALVGAIFFVVASIVLIKLGRVGLSVAAVLGFASAEVSFIVLSGAEAFQDIGILLLIGIIGGISGAVAWLIARPQLQMSVG